MTVPAEWAPHRAMWIGWPSHPDLWQEDLAPARTEVASLVTTLAGIGEEQVKLMAAGREAADAAREALAGVENVEIVEGRFGDIWLRDTGPIFTSAGEARGFNFNGWGGKYDLPGDDEVAAQIASHTAANLTRISSRRVCRTVHRDAPHVSAACTFVESGEHW